MAEDIQTVLIEIRERLVRVETKIDDYTGLRDKADKAYLISSNTKDRVDKIEDNQKWLWRSFAGAIIVAFVTAFITYNF